MVTVKPLSISFFHYIIGVKAVTRFFLITLYFQLREFDFLPRVFFNIRHLPIPFNRRASKTYHQNLEMYFFQTLLSIPLNHGHPSALQILRSYSLVTVCGVTKLEKINIGIAICGVNIMDAYQNANMSVKLQFLKQTNIRVRGTMAYVIPQSEIPPGRQSFAPDHSHSVRATFLPKEPMTSGMMNGNRQSYTTVIHPDTVYPYDTRAENYCGSYSPVAQGHNSWALQDSDRSYLTSSSYGSHEVFDNRQSGPVARNNSGSGHRINHPSSGMTSPTSGSWDLASLGPCSSRTRANDFNPTLKPFIPPPASSSPKKPKLACTFCKGRKIKCSRLDLGGDTEPCRAKSMTKDFMSFAKITQCAVYPRPSGSALALVCPDRVSRHGTDHGVNIKGFKPSPMYHSNGMAPVPKELSRVKRLGPTKNGKACKALRGQRKPNNARGKSIACLWRRLICINLFYVNQSVVVGVLANAQDYPAAILLLRLDPSNNNLFVVKFQSLLTPE
ncbi:hypothetical protein K435DRAFT_806318 [Dendrothele bispora CBS 962.96]|uniref:Zn(2)-C6 fungal-type domain-containing protein n=1 Tax=Dendrothele bispora (strain CBS 962.96) TaxID=1314807 RepID=A0A4V4HCW6_DENBC|nr:hypothetical protein K435DRAFT_806318 [Dendrothele bispora CBS 962.96]